MTLTHGVAKLGTLAALLLAFGSGFAQYQIVDPYRAERQRYYVLYEGAIFWAVYDVTQGGTYENDFAATASFEGANAEMPHPLWYTENPEAERDRLGRYALNAMPPNNELDRLDHRYLIARFLLANVPELTNDAIWVDGDSSLYEAGFSYLQQFESLSGAPTALARWSDEQAEACFDTNPIVIEETPLIYFRDTFLPSELEPADLKLEWLRRFTNCRGEESTDTEFATAYARIMPYVRLAVEDQWLLRPNPLYSDSPVVTANERGQGRIDLASRCYIPSELCTGETIDIARVCDLPNSNCRNALRASTAGNFSPAVDGSGKLVTVEDWRAGLLETWAVDNPEAPSCSGNDRYHLFPPEATLKRLPLVTEIRHNAEQGSKPGCDYTVIVGTYDALGIPDSNLDNRYFLMGLGRVPVADDTVVDALNRHWQRFSYANPAAPQSFTPPFCIAGYSHVIDRTTDPERWFWKTIIFQVNFRTSIGGQWFCNVVG